MQIIQIITDALSLLSRPLAVYTQACSSSHIPRRYAIEPQYAPRLSQLPARAQIVLVSTHVVTYIPVSPRYWSHGSPCVCPTDPRLAIYLVAPPRRRVAVYLSADSRCLTIHDIVARPRRNVFVADPLSWNRARPPLSNVRGRGSWRWSAVKVAHRARGLLGKGNTDQHVARKILGSSCLGAART